MSELPLRTMGKMRQRKTMLTTSVLYHTVSVRSKFYMFEEGILDSQGSDGEHEDYASFLIRS